MTTLNDILPVDMRPLLGWLALIGIACLGAYFLSGQVIVLAVIVWAVIAWRVKDNLVVWFGVLSVVLLIGVLVRYFIDPF